MDGIGNAEMFNSALLRFIYVKLFIVREVFKLRMKLGKSSPRILDIGCGTGWIANEYSERGFVATGLEPSAIRAEHASQVYGLNVINDYLENVVVENRYDVVMMRHVVEHFSEPQTLVGDVKKFIGDDGLLFIVVPNINCLGRFLFRTKWSWVLPLHCNFYTPKSIKRFMANCGFEVLSCYQTPSPLYYPASLARCIPFAWLRQFIVKHKAFAMLCMAPLAILGTLLRLGDNLNVIARVRNENIRLDR